MKILRILISVVVLGFGSVASAGELVQNGGFEVSGFNHWSGTAVSDSVNGVGGSFSGLSPYAGNKQAHFLNDVSETISQSLSTTVNGSETISFALADVAGDSGDSFKVYFGGTLLATISNPGSGYKTYSYNATATSASTNLSFTFVQNTGAWALDAVSVTESTGAVVPVVPEPSTFTLAWVACVSGLGNAMFHRRKAKFAA